MPYYVVNEGQKEGPYPGFRIIELLREGEILPDALGWEAGMAEWKKLREIPAFAEAIEVIENPPESSSKDSPSPAISSSGEGGSDTAPAPASSAASSSRDKAQAAAQSGAVMAAQTRPFTRFWARSFDYMLVSAIAWYFCEVPEIPKDVSPFDLLKNDGTIIPEAALLEMAKVHYAALILWHTIEGLLIQRWGTTPGKWLLGVEVVTNEGGRLSMSKGLLRSFYVWFAGFGLGLFPFNMLGMTVGLFMLLLSGATLWDRQLQTRVPVKPLTPRRILMVVGGFLLLMIISSLKFS